MKKFYESYLKSSYRTELEKEFGEVYSRQAENKVRLTDPCNADLQIQENKLVQKYFQVAAAPVTDFHGEQLGFYGLLKMMEIPTEASVKKHLKSGQSCIKRFRMNWIPFIRN